MISNGSKVKIIDNKGCLAISSSDDYIGSIGIVTDEGDFSKGFIEAIAGTDLIGVKFITLENCPKSKPYYLEELGIGYFAETDLELIKNNEKNDEENKFIKIIKKLRGM